MKNLQAVICRENAQKKGTPLVSLRYLSWIFMEASMKWLSAVTIYEK